MKKRIFSLVLCAALVLTLLAGCGGSSASSSTSGGAKGKKYKMAYVISTVDEFLGYLRDDVEKAAEEKAEAEKKAAEAQKPAETVKEVTEE